MKSKDKIKYMLTGFILCAALSVTALVAANTQTVTRQLTYGVAVNLHGEILQFEDDMRPFVIDGRTFLPVRAIAEALDLAVGFDEATNTVLLGDAVAQAAPTQSVSLLDLAGTWVISHATDEAGEEIEIPYTDWLPWTLEIREDYTFTWRVYGRLYGDLIYAGNGSFTGVNLVAWSEGETWYPEGDEVTISYDPQSGLLRYTRVIEGSPHIRHLYYAAWTTITAWYDSISVDIPSAWQAYERAPGADDRDPFGFLRISGEGIGGLVEIRFFESPISMPSMILNEFPDQGRFWFNDGHVGYMAEDSQGFVWIHSERGIIDIYLRHGGNRELFTYNEDVVLRIIRSLRYNN